VENESQIEEKNPASHFWGNWRLWKKKGVLKSRRDPKAIGKEISVIKASPFKKEKKGQRKN